MTGHYSVGIFTIFFINTYILYQSASTFRFLKINTNPVKSPVAAVIENTVSQRQVSLFLAICSAICRSCIWYCNWICLSIWNIRDEYFVTYLFTYIMAYICLNKLNFILTLILLIVWINSWFFLKFSSILTVK